MEGSKTLVSSEKVPAAGKYPWLIYYHGKGFRDQTFCTKTSADSFKNERRTIPKLQNNKVVSCSQGWLLLSDNGDILHYSIWNPITSESIDLPLLRPPENKQLIIEHCLLSSSPTSPNCLILLFVSNHPVIIYCHPGDEEWTEFSYEESLKSTTRTEESSELTEEEYILRQAVSCNGKIYVMSSGYDRLLLINVDVFNNIHSLSLVVQVRPQWYHPHSNILRTSLVESGEQIYFIQICVDDLKVNEETLVIEVDKFNFSTNTWEKVNTANGRALFLGSQYSISCPIHPDSDMEAEAGSYIYFTNSKDGNLYSYRIEDESLVAYLPCPELPKPWHLLPIWIMPADDQLVHTNNHHEQIISTAKELEEEEEEKEISIKSLVENRSGEVKLESSLLCDVPSEILALIAGKLSFLDYINFRCVNRLCNSTIPMRTTNSFSPCLVFYERWGGVLSFADSKLNAKYSLPVPETLKDHTIRYSKDSWLVMDKKTSVAAFNPLSNEIIQFPDTPPCGIAISSFIITAIPSSSDYLVFGLMYLGSQVYVTIKESGEEEWDYGELENDPSFKPCSNAPVFYQGSFYYMGKDGRLGVLELDDDGGVYWTVLDKPRKSCKHFRQIFLSECDGDLLSIFLCHKGNTTWIRIFKLNPSTREEWIETNTLGSYSLYVSRSSSFAAIAERPNLANRVYFPRFYQDSLVYYSLNTKKFHCMGTEDSLENLYGTRMPLDSAWIRPTQLGVVT